MVNLCVDDTLIWSDCTFCQFWSCTQYSILICSYLRVCMYVSVCLSICQSICLSVCPSVCLSVCLSNCRSVNLSTCLCLLICLSAWFYICLCVCLSVYISANWSTRSIFQSVRPFVVCSSFSLSFLSGYHAVTPITIKAEAILEADSQCNSYSWAPYIRPGKSLPTSS